MNEFQNELLKLRERITDSIKAELLGPGSEISFPDAEHELISEHPAERYSVGILYSQKNRFDVAEVDENDTNDGTDTDEMEVRYEDKDFETEQPQHISYKDDAFDEEVNLSQQNKPSSMGMTFFIKGDIESFNAEIKYAKYSLASENEIEIPYPNEDVYIHPALSQYIEYNKDKKTLKKLKHIRHSELSELFEINSIEDPQLFDIISNINSVFNTRRAYRRYPFLENATLSFEGSSAKYELKNTKAYVTAVKHKVANEIYGITIMLVNDEKDMLDNHIFQPVITVDTDGCSGAEFVSYNQFIDTKRMSEEEKSLELLYSKKLVFATGHGVSVNWEITDSKGKIYTDFMPTFEVPKINLELRKETEKEKSVPNRCLSMKYLSDLDSTEREVKISEMKHFIDCYKDWIECLKKELTNEEFDKRFTDTASKHISLCKESYERMVNGLEKLRNDDLTWSAFSLANRAMFMQRIHGRFQQDDNRYPNDEELQNRMENLDYCSEDDSKTLWRPFQLAFLLMSIESIVNPSSKERDYVDLIWFPTGGGKTEAYLGLTAFTIFYRRMSNLETGGGTAVIMRYTLRLLTSQQFTRASTLICACEKIRREEKENKFKRYKLGNEEITIGLWIGGDHIPNRNTGKESAKYYLDKLTATGTDNLKYCKDQYNKFQVLKCPWCGTKLVKDKIDGKEKGAWGYHMHNNSSFYISCTQEGCEFEDKLPIQIIDEELYKKPPTLLFGTVDKFAMMAWKKEISGFFGGKNATPDLIIQDELHLIAGPLGTMVGIYETAIDYLCSSKGKRPKIVASTATIRQASEQCRALYNREVRQFPAQGLDATDSFFAKEIDIKDDFGRLYLGIMPSGKTKVMLQARATAVALQSINNLKCSDEERDQFYTLAIYFNSLKELGKASSVVSDDVKDFIRRLTYRQIIKKGPTRLLKISTELTSRVPTSQLNDTLDKLEHLTYSKKNLEDKKYPIDILLATNMISVGIDVSRLNLMMLQGQPKSVSEYIQASSRIGRTNPGIAITLYDPSKSRDRSYYEQFKSFHESFYKFVEPTGITPFSAPARDRALHAIIISCLRQAIPQLNDDKMARNILNEEVKFEIEKLTNYIYDRVKTQNSFNPEGMIDNSEEIREQVISFIQYWKSKARHNKESLIYGDKYIVGHANSDVARLNKTYEDIMNDDACLTLTSLRNVDKTVPVSVLIWEDEYGS